MGFTRTTNINADSKTRRKLLGAAAEMAEIKSAGHLCDKVLDEAISAFEIMHDGELEDHLSRRADHLQAALMVIDGEAYEIFSEMNPVFQVAYVDMMSSLVNDIVDTIEMMQHERCRQREATAKAS